MSALDTWLPQSKHCVNTNQQMYERPLSFFLGRDNFCCSVAARQNCQELALNHDPNVGDIDTVLHDLLDKVHMNVELADEQNCVLATMTKSPC